MPRTVSNDSYFTRKLQVVLYSRGRNLYNQIHSCDAYFSTWFLLPTDSVYKLYDCQDLMSSLVWPASANNGAHERTFNQLIEFPRGIAAHYYLKIPDKRSLNHLSVTDKLFRFLCAPHLFQSLNIPFSMAGFNCLLQASQSWIAPYV
jgi:hypothetical protein